MWAALVVLAGAALRGGLASAGVVPFNSDEAIVGLMARHILGGQWPIFFYGQAYMGSLDAMLVALGFRLLGEQVIVIRAMQILLASGTIVTTMMLRPACSTRALAPVVAGMLVALAPVNVTLYTTVSLGGYGEALLLGNLILLLALDAGKVSSPWWRFLLWGVVAGLGFWAFGLTLVYSLPAAALLTAIALGWPRRHALIRVGWALLGIILGALPWLAYAASARFGDTDCRDGRFCHCWRLRPVLAGLTAGTLLEPAPVRHNRDRRDSAAVGTWSGSAGRWRHWRWPSGAG